jgi:phage terminase large subunit
MAGKKPEKTLQINLPPKLQFLFRPSRYKVAHGGRGGGKSHGFAKTLLMMALQRKMLILCAREYQNSIQESVHRLLSEQIDLLGFSPYYQIQQQSISTVNGSEFIFSGIRNNPTKIKSTEGIDIAWAEEAEKISDESWKILIPTVRKNNSEIWVSFNPDDESDPTYRRFVTSPPPDSVVQEINYYDNPWFPDVLRREMEYLRSVDMDAYEHIWLGKTKKHSKAQVLNGKWTVEAFEPNARYWHGPYFGADWGFASDPTTLVKCWIEQKQSADLLPVRKLYLEHEVWQVGLDINDTPAAFDEIPGAKKHTIRADSSRPETISYMRQHGYPECVAAPKWPGSV